MVAVGATKAYISKCETVFVFVIGGLMMILMKATMKISRSLSTPPAAGLHFVAKLVFATLL
jgi:hypothetical protein